MKLRFIAALTALSVNATAGFAADLPFKTARPIAPMAYSLTASEALVVAAV